MGLFSDDVGELTARVTQLEERLKSVEAFVEARSGKDVASQLENVQDDLQLRGEDAIKELMLWSSQSLRGLVPMTGLSRPTLTKILRGEGSRKSIRKLLIYHKQYAQQTGRA
jgi:hypothetical protein